MAKAVGLAHAGLSSSRHPEGALPRVSQRRAHGEHDKFAKDSRTACPHQSTAAISWYTSAHGNCPDCKTMGVLYSTVVMSSIYLSLFFPSLLLTQGPTEGLKSWTTLAGIEEEAVVLHPFLPSEARLQLVPEPREGSQEVIECQGLPKDRLLALGVPLAWQRQQQLADGDVGTQSNSVPGSPH